MSTRWQIAFIANILLFEQHSYLAQAGGSGEFHALQAVAWQLALGAAGHCWRRGCRVRTLLEGLQGVARPPAYNRQTRIVHNGARYSNALWNFISHEKEQYDSRLRDAPWRRQPASDGQRKLLQRLGREPAAELTKGAASDLITLLKLRQAHEAGQIQFPPGFEASMPDLPWGDMPGEGRHLAGAVQGLSLIPDLHDWALPRSCTKYVCFLHGM